MSDACWSVVTSTGPAGTVWWSTVISRVVCAACSPESPRRPAAVMTHAMPIRRQVTGPRTSAYFSSLGHCRRSIVLPSPDCDAASRPWEGSVPPRAAAPSRSYGTLSPFASHLPHRRATGTHRRLLSESRHLARTNVPRQRSIRAGILAMSLAPLLDSISSPRLFVSRA